MEVSGRLPGLVLLVLAVDPLTFFFHAEVGLAAGHDLPAADHGAPEGIAAGLLAHFHPLLSGAQIADHKDLGARRRGQQEAEQERGYADLFHMHPSDPSSVRRDRREQAL
jgi:hypothetical protein